MRRRIMLTLAPLLLLFAVLGGTTLVLLSRLGGRIDAILRENYDSIRAMERLNEAVERIDSSFQFALLGQKDARTLFDAHWNELESQFRIEEANITIFPDEKDLVDELRVLKDEYRRKGRAFHDATSPEAYFGPGGLLSVFKGVKGKAQAILDLNHDSMEKASDEARASARRSLAGFGVALLLAAAIASFLAHGLVGAVLGPLAEVTAAAQAIGAGNLDRGVLVSGPDELAGLATAFNAMTAQLRDLRRAGTARLLRAQRTAQATIDSFSDPVVVVEPTGAVELANPAAQALLGVRSGGRRRGCHPLPCKRPWPRPWLRAGHGSPTRSGRSSPSRSPARSAPTCPRPGPSARGWARPWSWPT
ncbi:MAG: HAMP domain-containing protein [Gemmataceae bacterium]|nr:HAMP domain-containing protein [Gemmataceae bacterium]